MTPSCAASCPTCGGPLPADAFWGPCAPCRAGMRQRAADLAAGRAVVFFLAGQPIGVDS